MKEIKEMKEKNRDIKTERGADNGEKTRGYKSETNGEQKKNNRETKEKK